MAEFSYDKMQVALCEFETGTIVNDILDINVPTNIHNTNPAISYFLNSLIFTLEHSHTLPDSQICSP